MLNNSNNSENPQNINNSENLKNIENINNSENLKNLKLLQEIPRQFVAIDQAKTLTLESTKGLHLKHGGYLNQYQLQVETYGRLNADKSNAVLICHALNASHHLAGSYSDDDPHPHKQGWWSNMIGKSNLGYPIDTDEFFIIGVNNIGSCFGSTGPASINPETQQAYGLDFPSVTIEDWVHIQKYVCDYFGIQKLAAVVGGSMGGMQAFAWSVLYPNCLEHCVVIASTPKLSAQNIAFNEVARQAILSHLAMQKENINGLDGLKLARMIGHITYLSDEDMAKKFGRSKKNTWLKQTSSHFSMDAEFEVESYLRYQADKFVDYFDPHTYLLCTKALDYFDASFEFRDLNAACAQTKCKYLMIAFTTDWRFPPARTKEWVQALVQEKKPIAYLEIDAPHGHDAFLMQDPAYHLAMKNYFAQIRKTL